jgi:hypothetical protein
LVSATNGDRTAHTDPSAFVEDLEHCCIGRRVRGTQMADRAASWTFNAYRLGLRTVRVFRLRNKIRSESSAVLPLLCVLRSKPSQLTNVKRLANDPDLKSASEFDVCAGILLFPMRLSQERRPGLRRNRFVIAS